MNWGYDDMNTAERSGRIRNGVRRVRVHCRRALLGLTVVVAASPAFSQDNVRQVGIGQGASCDEARQMAYRDAVQKAVGVFLSFETIVRNNALIKDQIIQFSDGYIDEFELLEETSGDGHCSVKIDAKIRTEQLRFRYEEISSNVVTFDGSDLAAQLETIGETRESALSLLKQVLAKLPTDFLLVRTTNIRQPNSEEKKLLAMANKKHKQSYDPDTALVMEVQIDTNDALLNDMFDALMPLMTQRSERFEFHKGLVEYLNRKRPGSKDPFVGLTSKEKQRYGLLEVGGVLDANVYTEWAKAINIGLGIEINTRCTGVSASFVFLDEKKKRVWATELPLRGFVKPFDRRNPNWKTADFAPLPILMLLHNRAKYRVSQETYRRVSEDYLNYDSWLPYHRVGSSRASECSLAFPILSKGHSFSMKIFVSIPAEILSKTNFIDARTVLSGRQKELWQKSVLPWLQSE